MGDVDVMVDLETLGTRPGSVVVTVGVVAFKRDSGAVVRAAEWRLDPVSQLLAGLTIDQATLAWWRGQSAEAQAALVAEPVKAMSLAVFAPAFIQWWGCFPGPNGRLWAQGTDFDPPMLKALLEAGGQDAPWRYNMLRDTRTAYDLLGFDPKSVHRDGTYHSALADALHQLKCLQEARAVRRAPAPTLASEAEAPVTVEVAPSPYFDVAVPEAGAGIYVASKTKYAAEWKARRAAGTPIISTWIDESGLYETLDWPDLWHRCITEAASASALVLICRDGDVLKGAWAEAGAALSAGRTVYAVGCEDFNIRHHDRFVLCASEDEAFARALAHMPAAQTEEAANG